VTAAYRQCLDDLGISPGSPQARAVGAVVRELATAHELPMSGDVEAILPAKTAALVEQAEGRRLLTAFVRHVKGRRLWVWYRPRDARVDLVALTGVSPT
jgi:hypothetical protein